VPESEESASTLRTEPSTPDESLLVERMRAGDHRAFDEVYSRYRDRIYGFLLRLSGRRDVADDLFQETFLKLARYAGSLRPESDLKAWLFTVARNLYLSHRRWAALDFSRLVTLGDETNYANADPLPDTLVEGARRMRLVEQALARLSPKSREALLLVGVEGFDQERAAAVVGVTYIAFRQRLSRARAELERALENAGASAPDGARATLK
jgi:RNA polymerase sigma-70 factor (ECF subfamily)